MLDGLKLKRFQVGHSPGFFRTPPLISSADVDTRLTLLHLVDYTLFDQ
jgi:hypothetical protein